MYHRQTKPEDVNQVGIQLLLISISDIMRII